MPPNRERAVAGRWSLLTVTAALAVAVIAVLWVVAIVVVLGADASAQEEEPGVAIREVVVTSRSADEVVANPLIDGLEPATVLTVRALEFDTDTTGVIVQCADDGTRLICGNRLTVRFDDAGVAVFQYLVTDAIGERVGDAPPCRLASAASCTIELAAAGSRVVIDTVFVDEAPAPGVIRVTPRRELVIGEEVTVTADGFPPGAEVEVAVCAVPATRGSRCSPPGPHRMLRIEGDGGAEIEMRLDVEAVGVDGVACARRTACQLVVRSDHVGVRARPVTLGFRQSPGASYDPALVAVGVLAAVLLGAAASWLMRITDWSPPREADGSPIDGAQFADLDLEAERFDDRHDPAMMVGAKDGPP